MVEHYNTVKKTAARQKIIDFWDKRTSPERILTFPSKHGYCAIFFKETFGKNKSKFSVSCDSNGRKLKYVVKKHRFDTPCQPYVVGIERSKALHTMSTLVKRNVVDDFRHLDSNQLSKSPCDLGGRFDLLFLDYTCFPSEKNADEVAGIIEHHAKKGSVVALTLCLNNIKDTRFDSVDDEPTEMDLSDCLKYYGDYKSYYVYKNANSVMCICLKEVK